MFIFVLIYENNVFTNIYAYFINNVQHSGGFHGAGGNYGYQGSYSGGGGRLLRKIVATEVVVKKW